MLCKMVNTHMVSACAQQTVILCTSFLLVLFAELVVRSAASGSRPSRSSVSSLSAMDTREDP